MLEYAGLLVSVLRLKMKHVERLTVYLLRTFDSITERKRDFIHDYPEALEANLLIGNAFDSHSSF